MSKVDPVPSDPLTQGRIVDVFPREGGGTATCGVCGRTARAHACHGGVWTCSDCCDDAHAGTDHCQRFVARERAGTLLVNRERAPDGWGQPHHWTVDREVVDIGRGNRGNAVLTNTDPGNRGWLGNPYRLKEVDGDHTRRESVNRYRTLFYRMAAENAEFRDAVLDLQGSILAGWCSPAMCHGDVILEWLDHHADG